MALFQPPAVCRPDKGGLLVVCGVEVEPPSKPPFSGLRALVFVFVWDRLALDAEPLLVEYVCLFLCDVEDILRRGGCSLTAFETPGENLADPYRRGRV